MLALLLCRRLSLALATVVMLLSLGTTYALQYMPNDPLHLRRNFSLYSLFVVFASGAGLVGAVKVRYQRRRSEAPLANTANGSEILRSSRSLRLTYSSIRYSTSSLESSSSTSPCRYQHCCARLRLPPHAMTTSTVYTKTHA